MMSSDETRALKPARSSCFLRVLLGLVLSLALLCVGYSAGMGTMWLWGRQIRAAATSLLATPGNAAARPLSERSQELLSEIDGILRDEFIDPSAMDADKMRFGAASGYVSALGDAHTVFVEPSTAEIMEQDMQGSFAGIGATLDQDDAGRLLIVRVLPNSPALGAGVQAGDVILAVDGQSMQGKTVMDAVRVIRGPKDTTVRLRLERKGQPEPVEITIKRDKVELPIVETKTLPGDIAYLRLSEFNAVSYDRVHEALNTLLAQKPKGLVFDLRGNPGGYLEMSVRIAGEFLPRNTLVLTERQRDSAPQEYRVRGQGAALQIPMVVLVNRASASASEIVAGALQAHQRATVVGEKSYGKGSVQNPHRLADGSSLRVTIAKWDLPNGQNLDGNGITPTIEVPLTKEDLAAGKDTQLERAAELLRAGK
jgi:carboxyl-terminal processing protease